MRSIGVPRVCTSRRCIAKACQSPAKVQCLAARTRLSLLQERSPGSSSASESVRLSFTCHDVCLNADVPAARRNARLQVERCVCAGRKDDRLCRRRRWRYRSGGRRRERVERHSRCDGGGVGDDSPGGRVFPLASKATENRSWRGQRHRETTAGRATVGAGCAADSRAVVAIAVAGQ
jgi:hypothetical protein